MSAAQFELALHLPLAHFTLELEVASGAQALGLFGASGAGKTSLLEVLAGWRTPERGCVRVAGRTLLDRAAGIALAPEQRGAGYVPQDALLFPHLDVARNVRFGVPRPVTAEHERHVQDVLAVLELAHLAARSVASLSGGERQRVALARALAARPRFLLLDEPLGALDLPLRRRILPYLARVRERFALPTLFVSHDPTEVRALCDEVLVLEQGRVRAQGRPEVVLRDRRGAAGAFENVLAGRVAELGEGAARLVLDEGGELYVPAAGLAPGARAILALGADEVLVALEAPTRISARNVLAARVEGIETLAGGEVRLTARLASGTGARLAVTLTPAARRELALVEGQAVFLVCKASSCRVLTVARE